MEKYCLTGQSPQLAVVPMEEEEYCVMLLFIVSRYYLYVITFQFVVLLPGVCVRACVRASLSLSLSLSYSYSFLF
jgi:hypothetical protein